jgi:hypothetical protein
VWCFRHHALQDDALPSKVVHRQEIVFGTAESKMIGKERKQGHQSCYQCKPNEAIHIPGGGGTFNVVNIVLENVELLTYCVVAACARWSSRWRGTRPRGWWRILTGWRRRSRVWGTGRGLLLCSLSGSIVLLIILDITRYRLALEKYSINSDIRCIASISCIRILGSSSVVLSILSSIVRETMP